MDTQTDHGRRGADAWAGLWLTWERWTSLSDHEVTKGFDLPEATPFQIAVVVVTVLAVGYLVKQGWRSR